MDSQTSNRRRVFEVSNDFCPPALDTARVLVTELGDRCGEFPARGEVLGCEGHRNGQSDHGQVSSDDLVGEHPCAEP